MAFFLPATGNKARHASVFDPPAAVSPLPAPARARGRSLLTALLCSWPAFVLPCLALTAERRLQALSPLITHTALRHCPVFRIQQYAIPTVDSLQADRRWSHKLNVMAAIRGSRAFRPAGRQPSRHPRTGLSMPRPRRVNACSNSSPACSCSRWRIRQSPHRAPNPRCARSHLHAPTRCHRTPHRNRRRLAPLPDRSRRMRHLPFVPSASAAGRYRQTLADRLRFSGRGAPAPPPDRLRAFPEKEEHAWPVCTCATSAPTLSSVR